MQSVLTVAQQRVKRQDKQDRHRAVKVGDMNGLRIGTPELVRWGMTSDHADRLAGLIARGLVHEDIADEVAAWRKSFTKLQFVHG